MKTALLPMPPPNKRRTIIFAVLACMAIIMLLIAGQSCNSINKATQQVLTNGGAFNKVGAAWAKLNPCVVDSTKTLVHDTTVKTDTAYKLLPAAAPLAVAPVTQNGTANIAHDTLVQTITKTITLHDSVKIVSVDARQLNICNDSVSWYKLQFANYKADSLKQTDGLKHTAQVRLWIIIAIIAALAMYIFRAPLLSLLAGGLSTLLTKKM